jgi:hypothetical protein
MLSVTALTIGRSECSHLREHLRGLPTRQLEPPMPTLLIAVCPVAIAPRRYLIGSLISVMLAALPVHGASVWAHDRKRPDLNSWYEGLHRNGLQHPCCSIKDCHKTDAEVREDGSWWGRLGIPVYQNPRDPTEVPNWILGEWIKINDEAIVRDDRGKPLPNPEGEAVICHDLTVINDGVYVSPNWTIVWCFLPPFEV